MPLDLDLMGDAFQGVDEMNMPKSIIIDMTNNLKYSCLRKSQINKRYS